MIVNAYSLYDTKALNYSPPFYAGAHGQAVRMVMELAHDSGTTVGRHPSDFTLYCVGQFNDATGELLPAATREHICDVLALIPAAPLDFFSKPDERTHVPSSTSDRRKEPKVA